MYDIAKEFLIAFGGGAFALLGSLTIFKSLFLKLFDRSIDAVFSKSFEKYRNNILRANRAYEILLEREMRYYEKLEPIFAELIPLFHDLEFYLKKDDDTTDEFLRKGYRENYKRYLEIIMVLKNEALIHHSYIPMEIFQLSTNIVKNMQDNAQFFGDMSKLLFRGDYKNIDYKRCSEIILGLLKCVAETEVAIRNRLENLSKLS